jgi:hypothetical protein
MDISVDEIYAILGQKEVELYLLRKKVVQLEQQIEELNGNTNTTS